MRKRANRRIESELRANRVQPRADFAKALAEDVRSRPMERSPLGRIGLAFALSGRSCAPVIKPTPRTPPATAHFEPPPIREAPLTARELEILRLISEGLFNKEIAKCLTLSEETVKTHMRHLLLKLQAHSRAHAVAIAFRQRLIT